MTAVPLVSVVMSVYNGEKYLDEAIASVLEQSFRNFEFIIIDDGSTDGTSGILQRYAEIDKRICVRRQKNLGLIASLNKGCRLAQGKYIARMDADDISLPERLARQVHYIETHSQIGVLGTWVEYIDESGKTYGQWRMPTQPGLVGWSLIFGTCLAHPTVIMRSDVLESLNYYRLEALHVEDYDLWTRASFSTRIANIPEVLLKRRTREDSICSQHLQSQEENVIKVMQTMTERLLGSPVSSDSMSYLRRTVMGPALTSFEQIETAANLIQRFYQAYSKAHPLTQAEAKKVAQDAANKLYLLAEWAGKISFWKCFVIMMKTVELDPLSFFFRLPVISKNILVGRTALE
jgi:glycosyltransferase involved in cell wall biosynthesis